MSTLGVGAAKRSKAITKEQIYANTEREVAALLTAGQDPRAYALLRQPDGSLKRGVIPTVVRCKQQQFAKVFPELKERRSITLIEHWHLRAFLPAVRYHLQERHNVWYAVATAGPSCAPADVGAAGERLVDGVARWFRNTTCNVELLVTVLHNWDVGSEARVHVNLHALFLCNLSPAEQTRLQRRFYRRFGPGSQMKQVDHIGRKVSYLFRTPDTAGLLLHGSYVEWSKSIARKRRIRCYNGFRRAKAHWESERLKPAQGAKTCGGIYNGRYELKKKRCYIARPKPNFRRPRIIEIDQKVCEFFRSTNGGEAAFEVIKNPSSILHLT